jgi:hypothetical protein
MKHHRFLMSCAVLLMALLAVNPAMPAAKKKARSPQREPAAKTALSTQEDFPKHAEREIANLRDDVYTRATWKKLQEVKQEADDTAGTVKLVTFSAAGIGFVFGCVITWLFARRSGGSDENLKIT